MTESFSPPAPSRPSREELIETYRAGGNCDRPCRIMDNASGCLCAQTADALSTPQYGEFNERWLDASALVMVDIQTTGALIREIQRLRAISAPLSETVASTAAHPTPRTDHVFDRIGVIVGVPETSESVQAALKKAREHAESLERENSELRGQLAFTQNLAKSNLADAETAERQLKAEQAQSACYLANWKATEKGYNELDKRRIKAERQLAEAQKDAERYRAMRNGETDPDMGHPYCTIHKKNSWGKWFNTYEAGAALDAAIDAALKENGNG